MKRNQPLANITCPLRLVLILFLGFALAWPLAASAKETNLMRIIGQRGTVEVLPAHADKWQPVPTNQVLSAG